MKLHRLIIVLGVFVLTLSLFAPEASRAQGRGGCVSPGDIFDMPTPGFLRRDTPNLIIEFRTSGTTIPITPLSKTTSRLRIQMPLTGLPSDERFRIYHIDGSRRFLVTNRRTCAAGTGGGDDMGSISGSIGADSAAARARLVPATRFDVVAPSGAPEFIMMGSASDVARAEAVVASYGGVVLRRREFISLGLGMAAVDLRGLVGINELRSELARRRIRIGADRHNVYSMAAGDVGLARQLVFGPQSNACRLRRSVRVGLIDGPVNARHPELAGVNIESTTVLNRGDRSATPDHGTGLAGLIAAPNFGLARGSSLFAATAVSRVGAREIARLEDIAAALDWMVSRKVEVVNMSLAGPSNVALSRAIERATNAGIVLVAAVGNNRRAQVAYPASDDRVIAVTAIDADKRLYRQASRGAAVDFAAPGVDLRVPISNRMAFRSGTSYAAAVVTALIAIELDKNRNISMAELRRRFARSAEDLGPVGRDTDFGFGLARVSGC